MIYKNRFLIVGISSLVLVGLILYYIIISDHTFLRKNQPIRHSLDIRKDLYEASNQGAYDGNDGLTLELSCRYNGPLGSGGSVFSCYANKVSDGFLQNKKVTFYFPQGLEMYSDGQLGGLCFNTGAVYGAQRKTIGLEAHFDDDYPKGSHDFNTNTYENDGIRTSKGKRWDLTFIRTFPINYSC